MELSDWLNIHNLTIVKVNDYVFEIAEVGKFLLLQPKDNKIINKEYEFIVSDAEIRLLEKHEVNFFCFQFGNNWYYSPIKKTTDKNSILHYSVELNLFKNVGDSFEDIDFVHLGIHSEYELLNGNGDLEDWVKKAKFLHHKALGICDKNTLAGTLALQAHCEKPKIKSIIGETVTVLYEKNGEDLLKEEVKLYVMNEKGWNNLLHINKIINVDRSEEQYITKSELLQRAEGLLIVFTKESVINTMRDYKQVMKYIKSYDAFAVKYYQVDTIIFLSDERDKRHLDELSFYFNNYCDVLPPVLINDSYYIEYMNRDVKKYLNTIGKVVHNQSDNQYYKTGLESFELIAGLFNEEKQYCGLTSEELILSMFSNTVKISEECNFKIETGNHKLPKYESDKDNNELFFELIEEGIEKKLKDVEDIQVYLDRIEKEVTLIASAGFIDYFLILWDFVSWSKKSGISVGTGRGSVGGCLVAYLLDIITIDPIKHDLLFERFLNEARISGERAKAADAMPDVDVDFLSERREEVKQYISERFGIHNTCSIGAYTTIKLKGAITDFAKVKGLDFKYVKFLTKKIPHQLDYTWSDLIRYALKSDVVANFVQKNHDIVDLIQYTLHQPRAISVHASAVIITPKQNSKGEKMEVYDWMPVRKIDGKLVSEWEGKYIDKGGFLKEDILALTELDKFKMALMLIKRNRGIDIVFEELPLDDEDTYKLFKKGYNQDIFQFGSDGLKKYSKLVKPDNIEELTAMNALYRPGPMKSNAHTDFGLIKFGKKKPEYDKLMEGVTKYTYGLYVYQEQIMQAMVVAGLSLVEADMARTYIKKFDKVKMAEFKDKFISNYADKLVGEKDPQAYANKVWDKLMMFSSYGFNKSHSAAYSLISYWGQYLKAHYPLEFWTTSLNYSKKEDVPDVLIELSKVSRNIKVNPPDINYSKKSFECDPQTNQIYWSLSKIEGLAEASVQHIIDVRKEGKFLSLQDFVNRVKKSKVNKAKIASLILAGCFDSLHDIQDLTQRGVLLITFAEMIGEEEIVTENYDLKLFEKEYYWRMIQKQLTGFGYIDYKEILKGKVKPAVAMRYYTAEEFFGNSTDYTRCLVVGILRNAYERDSKRGKFAYVEIDNNDSLITGNVWNETYQSYQDVLQKSKGKMIAIECKIKFDTWNNRNINMFHTDDSSKIYTL